MRNVSLGILVALTTLACKRSDVAKANKERLQDELEQFREHAKRDGEPWRAAIAKVGSGLPSMTDAPCPITVADLEVPRRVTWQARKPEELATAVNSREQLRLRAFDRLEHELANTNLDKLEDPQPFRSQLEQAASLTDAEFEMLVILDEVFEPHEISRDGGFGTFESGKIEGRVLVWSFAEARIICAAEAAATNSDSVTVSEYGTLMDNLAYNALKAGLAQARATSS